MKQFFTVLFGGLLAVAVGISIAYGGSFAWTALRPFLVRLHWPTISQPADGTTISGLSRTIRYTALEEEDLLAAASQSLEPNPTGKVDASVYLVTNLSTGKSLLAHDEEKIVPIASVTKLVTAIVARKVIDPTERITVGRNVMATYGNTADFKAGEVFQAKDLYYPLLMVSSNDAAEAFALAYGRKKFIQEMNDFVQSIGAYRTYFADPSGLSPFNVSSARDLTLIIDWIRNNDPELLAITTEKAHTVRAHTWINPTHFLSWSTYKGGKNGYTPEADRTSVSLFAHGTGKELLAVVVLGSEMRDRDVVTLLQKIR